MRRIQVSEIYGDPLSGAYDVVGMCQAGSVAGFCYASKDNEVEIADFETATFPVFGQWMSLVLIMTPIMRLTLKYFYDTEQSARLTGRALRRIPAEISQSLADDFMRELANTSAGHVKRALEAAKVVAGVSLPLVTCGFDNVFYDPSKMTNTFCSFWGMRTTAGEFIVGGVDVDVIDKRGFLGVNWVREVLDDAGEMEFL